MIIIMIILITTATIFTSTTFDIAVIVVFVQKHLATVRQRSHKRVSLCRIMKSDFQLPAG